MLKLKQGEPAKIGLAPSTAIEQGMKLKAGIYTQTGKPLFETTYPDDQTIEKLDENHFAMEIPHRITRRFVGPTTLRLVIYTADKNFVNAGENPIEIYWQEEPATKELK